MSEEDGDLVAQAGAKWVDINATLKEKGTYRLIWNVLMDHTLKMMSFRYPALLPCKSIIQSCRLYLLIVLKLDPSLGATLGGMMATGCSGSEIQY